MSEKRQIARAAGLVGALTVVSRVTGLVRDIVTGYLFGAGLGADAFFVAYRIPNLLRRLVAEGAATAAFIPVYTGYLATWLGSTFRTLIAALPMVPVVRTIVSRVQWFDGVTPLRIRILWLVLAVGAGASISAVALNVAGGAEVASIRRVLVGRLSRRAVARPS